MTDKELHDQLEHKLKKPETTLNDLLDHEMCVQWFREGDAAIHAFLKTTHFQQLIRYVTIVGPETQLLRSFQYPQVACDMLMSSIPRTAEVLLADRDEQPKCLLVMLLNYFKGQSNYVLSSYVIKILMMMYHFHPLKTQELVFEGKYHKKMVDFLGSRSVSQFMVKLIVVEDQQLLLVRFQERKELINFILNRYVEGNEEEEVLAEMCHLLTDVVGKIWSVKYKESGKFSEELLQIVEICIEKTGLYDQETLFSAVTKNLSMHSGEAPFLVKSLARKICKEMVLASTSEGQNIQTSFKQSIPKFQIRRLRLLHALTSIVQDSLNLLQPLLETYDLYGVLLILMERHEWNNIMQVEIQKIFKASLQSENQKIYQAIFKKGQFYPKIQDLLSKQEGKFGRGYKGCLINILIHLRDLFRREDKLNNIKWLSRQCPELQPYIEEFLTPILEQNNIDLAGFKVKVGFAQPKYEDSNTLLDKYKTFLDVKQMEQPTNTSQIRQMLDEIEGQSELNEQLVKEDVEVSPNSSSPTVSFSEEQTVTSD